MQLIKERKLNLDQFAIPYGKRQPIFQEGPRIPSAYEPAIVNRSLSRDSDNASVLRQRKLMAKQALNEHIDKFVDNLYR